LPVLDLEVISIEIYAGWAGEVPGWGDQNKYREGLFIVSDQGLRSFAPVVLTGFVLALIAGIWPGGCRREILVITHISGCLE
jgi:hypothetical protein